MKTPSPSKSLRQILEESAVKTGLNWSEVGRASGVTRGGIAKILSGDRVPLSSTLLEILRVLETSASVLDQWKIEDGEA